MATKVITKAQLVTVLTRAQHILAKVNNRTEEEGRDSGGQFSTGGGSSGGGKKPSRNNNMQTEEEVAESTYGGHKAPAGGRYSGKPSGRGKKPGPIVAG